jgi:hypothetical protein
MSFSNYLIESNYQFIQPNTEQLGIIKQELNRASLSNQIEKNYIEKSSQDVKTADSDFYVSGLALDNDQVIMKGEIIVEVTDEDNSVYYKSVIFIYNMDEDKLLSTIDNDKIRNEDWKIIQGDILKRAKKV